tara:strand:- start:3413 stop:3625 length:213 start_codon:yes stop_codon:yes gene_type:complete
MAAATAGQDGGRSDFNKLDADVDCYLSANPHFARSALSRYTQRDLPPAAAEPRQFFTELSSDIRETVGTG